MSAVRTSLTHPLRIAQIAAPNGGAVGITFCPGTHQAGALTGAWARDLAVDLGAIGAWGAAVLVTLVTETELADLCVEDLGVEARAQGLKWLHLPITDVSTPTPAWERDWATDRVIVHDELDRGGKVLVHCKGGLGRAGLVAAVILVERGVAPAEAIRQVRRVRPGAVETLAQERYVLAARRLPGFHHQDSGSDHGH